MLASLNFMKNFEEKDKNKNKNKAKENVVFKINFKEKEKDMRSEIDFKKNFKFSKEGKDVLFQRVGFKLYAFTVVDGEAYCGEVPPNDNEVVLKPYRGDLKDWTENPLC